MSAGVLAMLVGLFLVPVGLLWAGHNWRRRSPAVRGAFWGGVIAHSVAALVASIAGMLVPVEWSAADTVRGLAGYWLMLLASLVGMAVGGWLGSRARTG